MIKVTLTSTPDSNQFLLSFEANSAPGSQEELDQLYEKLMTTKFLGLAWKETARFEALIENVKKE